jgi:hypothetical protein
VVIITQESQMSRSLFRAPISQLFLLVASAACAGPKPASSPVPGGAQTPAVSAVPGAAPSGSPGATPTATSAPDTVSPSITLPKPVRVRNDRQLLTRDVILGTQYSNMYDVIQALRGNWLRTRAAESIQGKSSTVQVYLDNQRLTGADELKSMPTTNIETVRYYDPIQASSRWGMDHGAGAIYILTARAVSR